MSPVLDRFPIGGDIGRPFGPEPAMAWREITVGKTRWSVSPMAERTNRSGSWRLVLAFRPSAPQRPPIWAPTGLKADSRNDLFVLADRLSDDKLTQALAEKLG